MWILFALAAALGSAGTSFALKRSVEHAGAVISTVTFRILAGLLLLCVVAVTGGWPAMPPAYWRAAGLVLVPEVLGMLCLTLALRAGDLSLVQPLLGLIPPLVMLGGWAFLDQVPTAPAAAGVVLVTIGVYCIGLRPGASALEPLRALARERASWYAIGAALAWSVTTLIHKVGIDAVGPFPWGVTLALGSGLLLGAALPVMGRRTGGVALPVRWWPWGGYVAVAAVAFALQQAGLYLAMRMTLAGYVMAISSIAVLIAAGLGIVLLNERGAAAHRLAGALLVSAGAVLIALFG
ncbi:MAG TPA: EamA family transporter [Longimicrobium sp.]|nr:EamA family transporter [Longimicrobium sp.]